MFNNVVLDVFIGLVFIYLLYSLLATILQEIIANQLAFRSKVLEKAILRMLEDGQTTGSNSFWDRVKSYGHLFGKPNLLIGKTISPWFYAHPLIKYLGEDNFYSKPAYLSAQNFSKVMIDLLKGFGENTTNDAQTINDSINSGSIFKIPINMESDQNNPAVRAILLSQGTNNTLINSNDKVLMNIDTTLFLKSLWFESGADTDKFKAKLEKWFDDTMERCTGWYKRYNRSILFVLGLIIAIVFNVDTIAIHRVLSTDNKAREDLVKMAISKQEQYGEIVKNLQSDGSNSKQIKALEEADSIYKKTYRMLADDANEANTILGLGRPWKDSTKMIKDSTKRQSSIKNFSDSTTALEKANQELNNKIQALKDDTIKLNKIIKSKRNNIKTAIEAFSKDTADLNKYTDDLTKGIAQLNSLKSELNKQIFIDKRFREIYERTSGKCFVYAPNQNGGIETILGWLLTAWALCLGAPFWFDLLNKLISMRGTGTKIDSSGTNSSANTFTNTASANTTPTPIIVNTNQSEEAVG